MPETKTLGLMRESVRVINKRLETAGITENESTELARRLSEIHATLQKMYKRGKRRGQSVKKRPKETGSTSLDDLMK